MKISTFLVLLLLTTAQTYSQTPCSTGRYASNVYTTINTTSNITYGQNSSWTGSNTTLKLDFYEPAADTAAVRPLIIWVHGGSFIGGSKLDIDVATWAQEFTKKGYVCASIDYRLGFFPIDSANAVKAVVRAVQDLKGAIRFFYKDRATTNTYKVDTNHIFIGGSSAGAITALHVAYLNDACEISDFLSASTIASLGGLEGTSGNPGYSTNVHAVLNGCGALARYSWLESGDVPLCSMHGTNDGTVKYNRGIVNPGTPLMYLDGSRMLHERACAVGVENTFYTFPNAPHVPYAGSQPYMDTTLNFMRDFLLKQMGCNDPDLQPANDWMETANLYSTEYCDGSPVDEVCSITQLAEYKEMKLLVYPNPAQNDVQVKWESFVNMRVALYDFAGRNLLTETVFSDGYILKRGNLQVGTYMLELTDKSGNKVVKKLIFN